MTTPDGGQAFPVLECSMNNVTGEMTSFQSSYGLTIRDYFAAHAPEPCGSDLVQAAGLGMDPGNSYVYLTAESTVGVPFQQWWESLSGQRRCELRAKARYALADAMIQAAQDTLLSQEKAK